MEALSADLKSAQESTITKSSEYERRIRTLEDENRQLEEGAEDVQSQLLDRERHFKYQLNELESIRTSLRQTLEEVQNDLVETKQSLQVAQEKLGQRDIDVEALEAENIRLKAESAGPDATRVLQRELGEQLDKVKRLEAEVVPLRKSHKRFDVVEEEKKVLENQLQLMKDVETDLGNVRIQNQALQDERASWLSMLEVEGQNLEFDSPDAVVKALIQERIEKASLVEKLGTLQSEIVERDEDIKILESKMSNLQHDLEKARTSGSVGAGAGAAEARAKTRLERQRTLAMKEVEYLRAQLKTFDVEESTMVGEGGAFDEQKSKHIFQLEEFLTEHREEIHRLHEEISKLESTKTEQPKQEPSEPRGVKRSLSPADSEAESERLAVFARKNRTLQDTLSKADQTTALLQRELEAAKQRLSTLESQSRTRILELRANPTAEAEKIKTSTLTTLRAENRDLLAQLRNSPDYRQGLVKVVPRSTLDRTRLERAQLERTVAEKEKRMRRLKEIWTAKSAEFREAVASVLGYKLDFLPNGRVRVTSMFHLSPAYRHGGAGGEDEDDGPGSMSDGAENSIVFDGENGTMKISGGPNSLFAREIRDLIKFWVEERKDIPCFLAAMTLDLYDKTTRAARH